MELLYLYIETNGIFVVLLLILLFNLKTSFRLALDDLLFRIVLIFNVLVLVSDTACWIFDGLVIGDSLLPNKIIYALYYIFTALFVLVWTFYALYKIHPDPTYLSNFGIWLSIPIIVLCFLSIVSIWDGGLFKFDANGVYKRGDLFIVHTVILWLYVICSSFSAFHLRISKHNNGHKREHTAISLFALIPFIGSILQTAYYGLNLAWTGSAIALLIIFINIQNKQITTDALTGIYNRGHFSQFLVSSIGAKTPGKQLFLILMDINYFKKINDTYGHNAGDDALREVAGALSKACNSAKGSNHFPARYGGDEFVILCWYSDHELLQYFIDSINREIDNVNSRAILPFKLSISIGWAKYNPLIHKKPEDFIAEADEAMYINKQKKKMAEL